MTCPNYICGLMRRDEVTVEKVCDAWNLGYNMGKALEAVRDSAVKDPVRRAESLREARERIDAEISKTERYLSRDVPLADTHKCVPMADPAPESPKVECTKTSDNKPGDDDRRSEKCEKVSGILGNIADILDDMVEHGDIPAGGLLDDALRRFGDIRA